LELRHNLKDTFRIIGDDVVISNPLISFQYRRMLDRLGCPVSESKTVMHSGKLAEFAGHVILSRQGIIPPKKVLEDKDSNLLERIRRKVQFNREVKTPLDLISVITSRENPLGLTLWERAAFRSLLKEEEAVHLIQEARDKEHYYRLKYAIINRVPSVMERFRLAGTNPESEFPYQVFNQLAFLFEQKRLPLSTFEQICQSCGVVHSELPPKVADFLWLQLHAFASRPFYFGSPNRVSLYASLKKFLRRQVASFQKSKQIREVEILSAMIEILEEA
jgi:hypothetical protein